MVVPPALGAAPVCYKASPACRRICSALTQPAAADTIVVTMPPASTQSIFGTGVSSSLRHGRNLQRQYRPISGAHQIRVGPSTVCLRGEHCGNRLLAGVAQATPRRAPCLRRVLKAGKRRALKAGKRRAPKAGKPCPPATPATTVRSIADGCRSAAPGCQRTVMQNACPCNILPQDSMRLAGPNPVPGLPAPGSNPDHRIF